MEELRRLVRDMAADETATLEQREAALKAAIAEQREAGIEISATTCDTRWRRIRHGDMTDSIENPYQLFDIRKLDARWTYVQAVWGGYVAPNLPGQADTLVVGDPDTPLNGNALWEVTWPWSRATRCALTSRPRAPGRRQPRRVLAPGARS
jgi:hypothetical protein